MFVRIIVFMVFIFASSNSFAQSNFSESFFNMSKNSHLFIPSNACLGNDYQVNATYKSYFGKLSVIRTFYADANATIKTKTKSKSSHCVGGGFYSDQEGEYFTKNRIIARYAKHIQIANKKTLAIGTAVHLLNYSFDATGANAFGSDWSYSLNISSTYHSPSTVLAVAVNDFNSPVIKPINYEFTIDKYMMFYAEKKLRLGLDIEAKGVFNYTLMQSRSNYYAQLGLLFSKTLGVNAFYFSSIGSGFTIDLNQINIYNQLFNFSFAYIIPKESVLPPVSQYELNLLYFLKKNN